MATLSLDQDNDVNIVYLVLIYLAIDSFKVKTKIKNWTGVTPILQLDSNNYGDYFDILEKPFVSCLVICHVLKYLYIK